MARARTTVTDVSTLLQAQLRRELATAAGPNKILSKAEEANASPLVKEAAEALREKGKRLTTDALEKDLTARAKKLIGSVNQPAGAGAALLSHDEARAASRKGGHLGAALLRAYEVAAGNGPDVDAIATARASAGLDDESVFKTFPSETAAYAYADPEGRHVRWLVPESETVLSRTFLAGRNDLWSERFEVDRLTGAITILAEH